MILISYLSFRFIKIFEYKELGCGEKAWVLNNLEISSEIILKVYKELQGNDIK